MRCLAVCQDELVIRMLDEILLPGFEVEFIVENRPLARRLHDAGVNVTGTRSCVLRFVIVKWPSTCQTVLSLGPAVVLRPGPRNAFGPAYIRYWASAVACIRNGPTRPDGVPST